MRISVWSSVVSSSDLPSEATLVAGSRFEWSRTVRLDDEVLCGENFLQLRSQGSLRDRQCVRPAEQQAGRLLNLTGRAGVIGDRSHCHLSGARKCLRTSGESRTQSRWDYPFERRVLAKAST